MGVTLRSGPKGRPRLERLNPGLTRRADIQWLRAVAVIAVIFHHFGGILPGGFLGVDVFFVVSGFVITLSLLRLISKSSSPAEVLKEFWKRRIARLVPILTLVIVSTLLVVSAVEPTRTYVTNAEMALWSFAFLGNVGAELVESSTDYFSVEKGENWLLHLWSLGVEEQFYLFFPLLTLFIITSWPGSRRIRVLFAVFSGLLAASFFAAVYPELEDFFSWSTNVNGVRGLRALFGYYSPLTRAWQLLAGVLCALLVLSKKPRAMTPGVRYAAWAVLFLSFALTVGDSGFPGFGSLPPVIATGLLLVFEPSRKVPLLGGLQSTLERIGDQSYSIYLWHYPVWTALAYLDLSWMLALFVGLVVTLGLSSLSRRYVERLFYPSPGGYPVPGVGGRYRRLRKTVSLGLICGTVLSLAPLVAHTVYVQNRWWVGMQDIPQLSSESNCLEVDCRARDSGVVLIGDSHAGALSSALEAELASRGIGIDMYVSVACLHLPSTNIVDPREECQTMSARVRSEILSAQPQVVVIYGYTSGRFTPYNSGNLGTGLGLKYANGEAVPPSGGVLAYEDALAETVNLLIDAGVTVVIVSGTPDFAGTPSDTFVSDVPSTIWAQLFAGENEIEWGHSITKENHLLRNSRFVEIERQIDFEFKSVHRFETWDYLCEEDICRQVYDVDNVLFADTDHLAQLGASKLAKPLADEIRERLNR